MTVSRQFLTDPWIDARLESRKSLEDVRGSVRRAVTTSLLTQISGSPNEAAWASRMRERMSLCELEYVRGNSPDFVRSLCLDFARSFLPELPQMDFSPRTIRGERMLPSDAKELAEQHGGKWWKADQYYAGVEYSEMNQPFGLHIHQMWMIAAVGGDRNLARQIAEPYLVPEVDRLRAEQKYVIRRYILRHALADDHRREAALAEMLLPGYARGTPPHLIEFPLAVVRGDEQLLRKALKRMSTTFKGTWNVRRMRTWYDKRSHLRSTGTWEQVLERSKQILLSHQFIFSWWALAWLNIARWRGMTSIFQETRAFSEWIPLSLCDGGEEQVPH